jgi:hypothetical protein
MKTSKILWGLLILGCGIMLLLAALGLGEQYDAFRIIGSILLLGIAITSVAKLRFFFFILPLAAIAYLWRVPLGIAELDVKLLLAGAVLLGIGLSVIFRRNPHHHHHHEAVSACSGEWRKSEETLNDNEFVNIDSSFGEHTKYIHADNLKRVNIASNFSSVKVYFDQCQLSSEGLVIHISGNFSGIVLSLPRAWHIENRVSTFAAAVSERDTQGADDVNKVVLSGSINFAEVKLVRI